jgi:hypothetical protein
MEYLGIIHLGAICEWTYPQLIAGVDPSHRF